MYVRLALIGTIVGLKFHRIKFGERDSLDFQFVFYYIQSWK